jgi:hypothetical protein
MSANRGPSTRRISRHSALIGTIAWVVWQLAADVFEPVALFVLSPLVLVPLLLTAIFDEHDDTPLIRALSWSQLPCALALPLAASLAPGGLGLLAALPWVGWTVLAAWIGLTRAWALLRDGGVRGLFDGELAIAAGLGFPLVGSGWFVCDRLALEPLGFSPLIVLLTAAHFHHAGFTLPLSAGLLARALPQQHDLWRITAVTVVLAVPLVALGITFSPLLELIAALITAGSGIAVAIGMLLRSHEVPTLPGLLSALAGSALLAGMSFAGSYAIGEFQGVAWPDIVAMIRLHGAINALGFGLLGAWAWHLRPPSVRGSQHREPVEVRT